jgi:predicted unusual protein kinase regulating ubiquinone biosynthesis (AarF/ABC1/UbiB family)
MDGTEVAIKIIYPWLRKDLSSDFAVFRMMGDQIQPGGEHLWDVLFMGDQIQPGP